MSNPVVMTVLLLGATGFIGPHVVRALEALGYEVVPVSRRGGGDRQRRFRWLLRPMLEHRPKLIVDPAWGAWRTTYGYVVDVAHALATAAVHPAARGRIFNVGRADVTDHRDWIGRYAAQLGWRGEVIEEQAHPDNPIAGLDLSYPLLVDSRAFRQVCGWSEPTRPECALRETIEDEDRRG